MGGNIGGSVLPLVHQAIESMKANVPQGLADLTGGEYIVFENTHSLDEALSRLSNHAHNRYQLSFQVSQPAPGFHRLEVGLRAPIAAMVFARAGYWPDTVASPSAGSVPAGPATTGSPVCAGSGACNRDIRASENSRPSDKAATEEKPGADSKLQPVSMQR
jgi:hypothetical protein